MIDINEGNKLIAEYMGFETGLKWMVSGKVTARLFRDCDKDIVLTEKCEYHCSWNELMPVVERINATEEYDIIIFRTVAHVNDKHSALFETSFETSKKGNLIMSIWEPIVEFIKWHNNVLSPDDTIQ